MTTIEIDIDDYLTEADKQEIAREQFAAAFRSKFTTPNHVERLIGNAAYVAVWNELDEVGGEGLRAQVCAKIPEVIEGLSAYTLFARGDSILRSKDTPATVILDSIVNESATEDLIRKRVEEVIGDLGEYEIKALLKDHFAAILDGVFREES